MSDPTNCADKASLMSRYEFTCPDCGQEIEVNESMREATLSHGCPVCGSTVAEEDFVIAQQSG